MVPRTPVPSGNQKKESPKTGSHMGLHFGKLRPSFPRRKPVLDKRFFVFPDGKAFGESRKSFSHLGKHLGGARKRFPIRETVFWSSLDANPDGKAFLGTGNVDNLSCGHDLIEIYSGPTRGSDGSNY